MLELHHFSFSWQLIPEKGSYEQGQRPKSGTLRFRPSESDKSVTIEHQWVDLNNTGFITEYHFDNNLGKTNLHSKGFETIITDQKNQYYLSIDFFQSDAIRLQLIFELLPNGILKLTKTEFAENLTTHTEYYHKQFSVLPYASSVGTAVIRPTETGMIRHKALTAMEEQTNMQLNQIRKQIELLAQQAQEIYQRKELSLKIYNTKITFQPVIGQTYHLYSKDDESFILSMISPNEWGRKIPFQTYHGPVKMLADHTWIEASE